jgi:hypothetical protein
MFNPAADRSDVANFVQLVVSAEPGTTRSLEDQFCIRGEESVGYDVLFLRNECQTRGSFALGREIGALFFKLFGFLGRHRSVDPG